MIVFLFLSRVQVGLHAERWWNAPCSPLFQGDVCLSMSSGNSMGTMGFAWFCWILIVCNTSAICSALLVFLPTQYIFMAKPPSLWLNPHVWWLKPPWNHGGFVVQETIHGHLKIASKLADPGYARAALLANADPRAQQAFGVGKRPAGPSTVNGISASISPKTPCPLPGWLITWVTATEKPMGTWWYTYTNVSGLFFPQSTSFIVIWVEVKSGMVTNKWDCGKFKRPRFLARPMHIDRIVSDLIWSIWSI